MTKPKASTADRKTRLRLDGEVVVVRRGTAQVNVAKVRKLLSSSAKAAQGALYVVPEMELVKERLAKARARREHLTAEQREHLNRFDAPLVFGRR